jgi:CubicO group peptidase (beta-lactamase class C family)
VSGLWLESSKIKGHFGRNPHTQFYSPGAAWFASNPDWSAGHASILVRSELDPVKAQGKHDTLRIDPFMKTSPFGGLCLLVVSHFCQPLAAAPLPRSAPEAQGVASTALLGFVKALDSQIEGMHSVMVLRHGQVIAEGWWAPYSADHNHVLYSLSKSFTSTAVGLAVTEGKLSVDDEVTKFFPEDVPADASNNLKAMRVRDLLTMSTGHQDEPPTAPELVSSKSFLAQPVPHLPGTHFKYNTAATFMQSAIVQKVTGQTVLDYLRPRLFEPLGIEHPVWDANFQGISLGGYGLRVRTEDIAKFGQLYLQKGKWNGKQLLPAAWVEAASAKQVSNGSNPKSDWNQGYGFQFWRCRHNAFRGDGAFGQYCIVMPEQDAVIAITSGIKDMQAVLNLVWDKFLPACQPKKLRANRSAQAELISALARLKMPPVAGEPKSDLCARVLNRKFSFPASESAFDSLTVKSVDGGKSLTLVTSLGGKETTLPAGFQEWRKGQAAMPAGRLGQFPDEPVAGTFAWTATDKLEVKVCAYETPFNMTFNLRFDGDQVTVDREFNVSFGPTKLPALAGKAEP